MTAINLKMFPVFFDLKFSLCEQNNHFYHSPWTANFIEICKTDLEIKHAGIWTT